MSNPLVNVLTPKARGYLYAAYFLAGVALGVCQIIGVETGKATEVLAYLAIPFGITAASNASPTPTKAGKHAAPEDGVVDAGLILLVYIAIGVTLLLFHVRFGG